jgi:hypothetical protein
MGNYFSNVTQQINNPIDKFNKFDKFNSYKNEKLHININNVNTYIPKLDTIKE